MKYLEISRALPEAPEGFRLSLDAGDMTIDGEDGHIALWKGNRIRGLSSVVRGLEGYYSSGHVAHGELSSHVKNAVEMTKGKLVLCQMQGAKNIEEDKIDYRRELFESWKKVSKRVGESIDFIISSDLCLWNFQAIKERLRSTGHPLPSEKILRYNYEELANSQDYRLCDTSQLFVNNSKSFI